MDTQTETIQCLCVRKIQDTFVPDARRIVTDFIPMQTTNALRDAIQKAAYEKGYLKADDAIELWMPKENIMKGTDATERLEKQLKASRLNDLATPVEERDTVESLLRPVQTRQSNYIHVLVQVVPAPSNPPALEPEPEDLLDTVTFMNRKFQELLIDTGTAKSPSMNTKSTQYRQYQSGLFPILDGRYAPLKGSPATQAPPIEIFHPVFAQFRVLVADVTTEIPPELISETASFMRSVSAIRPIENTRTLPSRLTLSSILGKSFVQNVNHDGTSADHVVLGTTERFRRPEATALALVEEKGEMGASGDPSVQGSFSYTKFWLGEEHSGVRNSCCCPTFIIALAGSWLAILGAVTTTQYITQRLTNYIWLGNSRVGDDLYVISVARTLYALRRSLESLDIFYKGLEARSTPDGCLHPRFLPSITSYPSNNATVKFTYTKPLELDNACMTFLATLDSDDQSIVVKFVQRYGDAVHRNLASFGMAPGLLYYGPIVWEGHSYGDLKMVVMEYIQGETLAQYFGSRPIPQDVIAAVRKGIDAIHTDGYVYGDLRRPNVMIMNPVGGNAEANLGERVRFIDFDWAGPAGDARYPLHLSESICEAAGTSEYELITMEHDIKMLNAL